VCYLFRRLENCHSSKEFSMRSTRFFLSLSFFGLWPILLQAEVKYASFPAVGVELPQPEGFVTSKQLVGLENPLKHSVVQINVIPGPFSEISTGFTPRRLATAQMRLYEKTEATIAGKQALLMHVTQTAQGVEIEKWLAVFGDKKSTTLLNAMFLPAD